MLTVTICDTLFFIVFYQVHKTSACQDSKLIPQPLWVKTCLGAPVPWGNVGGSLLPPSAPFCVWPSRLCSDSEVFLVVSG